MLSNMSQNTAVFGFGIIIPSTLVIIALFFIVKRYKVVENNEILIIESWIRSKKLRFVSGGGSFIFPLFESYTRKSLIPMELNIELDRVMTKGNIPLGGKIFAQVVIDDSDLALFSVAKHLSNKTRAQQMQCATEILNGVLRETVANLTPEEVLEDKERFKEEMLKNAVVSLAHIGLKIKTLNIQEISDHLNDNNGYISQLMRPRGYRVSRDTRIEVSDAESAKVLKKNEAHKAMRIAQLEQDKQSLEAEMNYKIEQIIIKGDIETTEISAENSAKHQEIIASLETKNAELKAIKARLEADVIQKAIAQKEKLTEDAKAKSAQISNSGDAEVEVLKEMLSILNKSPENGIQSFLIDNMTQLSDIFTNSIDKTSFQEVNIIEGNLKDNGSQGSFLNPQNIAVILDVLKSNGLDVADIIKRKDLVKKNESDKN